MHDVGVTDRLGERRREATPPGCRILVVDDDPNIIDLVATVLRYEKFGVEVATTARKALEAANVFRPHLILLDVMLPDADGFEVQRRLAGFGLPIPIIFLSARDATEDKVLGLTRGADDYVSKPFSLEELIARIRTVLRRNLGQEHNRVIFGELELDEDTYEAWRDGEPINLSPTEFKLLRLLMLNPRRVMSKTQILAHVWRYDFQGDASIVETYISYLRKKVDYKEPRLIHTVRGLGYSLRIPGA